MNFASDNTAGVSKRVLDGLAAVDGGTAPAYGTDMWTARAESLIGEIFECDLAAFLVPTGTAANALALAALTPPYGTVLTHEESHIMVDECGAPEMFTGGAKLLPLHGINGKIDAEALRAVFGRRRNPPHNAALSVLSLTQVTEYGTVYTPQEVAALSSMAREQGLKVHMDGARFANALAALGCTPAEVSWRAGVDVLCLGMTKNGALSAEAVIFFDRALAEDFSYRRKRSGHLLSKGRFIAAQFVAMMEDGLWMDNARHANAMAKRLAAGLDGVSSIDLPVPVEANALFPVMSRALCETLRKSGAIFHPWSAEAALGRPVEASRMMVRLVTSFATTAAEVDAFVSLVREIVAKAAAK